MKQIMRFRIRRPFQIGRKFFSSGFVSLSQIFPQVANLLAIGAIEDVPLEESLSDCVVVIKASVLGELGQVLAVDDLPQDVELLERSCHVLRLYDAELNEVYTCRDCLKSFFGHAQAAAHKRSTGHRLRKREKRSLDDEDDEPDHLPV